jgi:catechol 2,3-dioxygenase-like lactoylglutathione lyase family enzyme
MAKRILRGVPGALQLKPLAFAVLALAIGSPVRAQLPDTYRTVASVHWAVKDVERVKAGWAKLGFPALQDLGEMTVSGSWRGRSGSARVRVAQARFAGLEVVWIEPLEGENAFTEYLARHGEGIVSLNYRVQSREALDAEIARLGRLGVGVLQRADVATAQGRVTIVHMDTEAGGKYVLGLVHGPAPAPAAEAPAPPFPVKLSQYALVVKSLEAVSAYWQKLGFPAMNVTQPPLTERRYRGEPGRFDQKLGWHRHGTVTWEWIEPLSGPTVYLDFLEAHGEGFHHLGFDVPDIDAAAAAWARLGVPVVQSGAWGDKGKRGSGRFAYAGTDTFGGVTIELLWNYR